LIKQEEDKKRQLTLKLKMASFLQDTLSHMSQKADEPTREFLAFMDRVRLLSHYSLSREDSHFVQVQHGQPVTKEALSKYSNIFSENFTLMDASQQRPLLIAMCNFLGLGAYGTNSFLRWQIRVKLGRLREDDKVSSRLPTHSSRSNSFISS